MKIDRQKVYQKYDGHCAYCGVEIEFEDMQVDHIHSTRRFGMNNHRDNLNPSCQKCNIHKATYTLKEWRGQLQLQVKRLQKNAQFDRALRFGQVQITEKSIKFYFEKEGYK